MPPASDENVAVSRLTATRSSCCDDVPEALAARVVLPVDRGLLAEAVEHLPVLEALEAVEVEKVDAFESHVFPQRVGFLRRTVVRHNCASHIIGSQAFRI